MIRIQIVKILGERTLYWLSRETGIRWATLAAMASGKAKRVDLNALERICAALECQPGDLLIRVERKARKK
jgi:putative transcriptional regulator